MKFLVCNGSRSSLLLIFSIVVSMVTMPLYSYSLRDLRNGAAPYRYAIMAVVSAGIVYGFSHKLVKHAIKQYNERHQMQTKTREPQEEKKQVDYFEAVADIFIKSTKVIGTIFKVVRAATCPAEGKITSDQWLDDFSQLA